MAMSIRNKLNRSPALVAGITVVAIALAVYVIYSQSAGGTTIKQTFYSNDDGKTFFKDSVQRVAPFEKDGRPAYKAFVVECGGKRSVAFMERYTEKAKPVLEKIRSEMASGKAEGKFEGDMAWISQSGTEYKRPGESTWVSLSDSRSAAVRDLKCGDGSSGDLVQP